MWEGIVIKAYGYYRQARNASWQCLLDVGIASLPVKTLKIAEHFGIRVLKNSQAGCLAPDESGCSVVNKRGEWTIVYNDNEPQERVRYTIAHELGHILLGHELRAGFVHHRKSGGERKPIEETQADEFAARVLAPACVLWALDLHTAEEISEVCRISYTAAKHRAERMEILYARNKFLTSPLERRVFEQFTPWIGQQKKRI